MYHDFRNAGWSSLVARRAHNPKVVGSNPSPATKYIKDLGDFLLSPFFVGLSLFRNISQRPRLPLCPFEVSFLAISLHPAVYAYSETPGEGCCTTKLFRCPKNELFSISYDVWYKYFFIFLVYA